MTATVVAPPGPAAAAATTPAPRTPLLRRPLAACALLLLLYVALSLANNPHGYLGTDTGGKVATLRTMQATGSLQPDVRYWAQAYDHDGVLHPLALTAHLGGEWVNVTTLPMIYAGYPLYLAGGPRAILLLPMLGGVLTALGARALARRLDHPLDEEPAVSHHVDVSAERAMHEGQPDARGDLLQGDVVGQVGPDPPVLLTEDVVVDPAAPRGLEQRVV